MPELGLNQQCNFSFTGTVSVISSYPTCKHGFLLSSLSFQHGFYLLLNGVALKEILAHPKNNEHRLHIHTFTLWSLSRRVRGRFISPTSPQLLTRHYFSWIYINSLIITKFLFVTLIKRNKSNHTFLFSIDKSQHLVH